MAYVGVEFSENGLLGLVHSSWLTPLKQEVFWPPYKTSNSFNKALIAPEDPDQSTWKIFAIKRTYFECDDIEKAKKKLRICEDTSDVQSSESDFDNRKRSRVVKKKCISECESVSEDEGHTESIQALRRPPVFPKLTIIPTRNKPKGGSSSQPISTFRTATSDANVGFASENDHFPIRNVRENSIAQPRPLQHLTAGTNVTADGLEKFFQEIKKLREEVKEVKALLKQSRNSVAASLPDDICVQFPLKIIADLQMLEEYLITEEKHNDVASYFSSLGGTGITARVNRILRFVMTNKLATQYNFAGQRNAKQAFVNTKIKSAIIRAIQIKSPATSQADIENAIKVWLKHAKQRMQKEPVVDQD